MLKLAWKHTFFNNVPTGGALSANIGHAGGFDLVSSAWVDWQACTLHSEIPEMSPQIRSKNGDKIICHGYISGRFLPQDLSGVWIVTKLFVVDVVFVSKKEPKKRCYFLLSEETLSNRLKFEGDLNTVSSHRQ